MVAVGLPGRGHGGVSTRPEPSHEVPEGHFPEDADVVVMVDRYSAYKAMAQVKAGHVILVFCWAHLKRDFQKLVDRGGPAEAIGRVGLEVVECLFADWWAFRRGELDRPGLQSRLDPIARELQGVLEQGCCLRGFQGGDLLRQHLGPVPGVVVVRGDRGSRAHEQSCGTHPAVGRTVAEERLRLPQRGGVPVRGADADRGPNPAVAETSGAGLPVSRDRGSSGRPSRSAITGPRWGLNGYLWGSIVRAVLSVASRKSSPPIGITRKIFAPSYAFILLLCIN